LFFLDSSQRTTLVRFRRNDRKGHFSTFYEAVKPKRSEVRRASEQVILAKANERRERR
jgi:hypothetical protein